MIPDKMNTADWILTATVWPLNVSSGEPRGVSSVWRFGHTGHKCSSSPLETQKLQFKSRAWIYGSSNSTLNGLKDELKRVNGRRSLTCVDELYVPLQVAIDHKNLVAAWVRARPFSHLLVMLLDVLLEPPRNLLGTLNVGEFSDVRLACWRFQPMISITVQLWLHSRDFWPLAHQEPDRQRCIPDMDTCRCWAALLWKQQIHGIIFGDIGITVKSMKGQHIFFPSFFAPFWVFVIVHNYIVNKCVYPFGLNLFFQPGLGPGFFLTLDSSGTFGLRLLFRIAPFRALEGKLKRVTPELLTSAISNDGQWKTETPTSCLKKDQTVHHHRTSRLFCSPPNHLQRRPWMHSWSYNSSCDSIL